MAFTKKKQTLVTKVIEAKHQKVKGGKGKKKYRDVPIKEQIVVETDKGRKYSETYLSGDSKKIQDMIEELYNAKSKKQFKGIQQQFRLSHPDLTDRMLKDPVIMFTIPQWEERESVGDWMQEFMALGEVSDKNPRVSAGYGGDRAISPYSYDKMNEEARVARQAHKSPDIGRSRF